MGEKSKTVGHLYEQVRSPKRPQAGRVALYLELKGVWDDVPLPPGPIEELGMICRFQDREMEAVLAK